MLRMWILKSISLSVFKSSARIRSSISGAVICRKETCQWHVFSPWESPFPFQTRPVGVWMEWKHLVSGVSHLGYTVFVFPIKGTRKFKCNSPVDCCLPPARRRQHLNVTSPFWRTATSKRKGGTRKGGGSVCSGLRLWQHGQ